VRNGKGSKRGSPILVLIIPDSAIPAAFFGYTPDIVTCPLLPCLASGPSEGPSLDRVIRYLAVSGFGVVFLWVSAPLRLTVVDGLTRFEDSMAVHAPWSYVGGVVLLIAALLFSFNRGAQAR